MNIVVSVPARNEAGCIGELVQAAWTQPVAEVIVVNNGSTDEIGRAHV